jgi:hypothetical protein
LQVVRVDGEVAVGGHAGIGIALILRDAGLVIAIAASCGAITALVIYGLQLRWALSLYVAGLAALTKNTAALHVRLRAVSGLGRHPAITAATNMPRLTGTANMTITPRLAFLAHSQRAVAGGPAPRPKAGTTSVPPRQRRPPPRR